MYSTLIKREYNLGRVVTDEIHVLYSYTSFGSETTYSPIGGADGGDPVEIQIESAWANFAGRVRLTADEVARVDEFACEHVGEAMDDEDMQLFHLDMNEMRL